MPGLSVRGTWRKERKNFLVKRGKIGDKDSMTMKNIQSKLQEQTETATTIAAKSKVSGAWKNVMTQLKYRKAAEQGGMGSAMMPAMMMPAIAEKTLADVLEDISRARGFIMMAAVMGALTAGLLGFVSTPQYRGQIIVGPAQPMSGSEVSSMLANENVFALRHLVQRVSGANASDFVRFENIYYGPSIAAQLLEDPVIVTGLNADQHFMFWRSAQDWSPALLSEYLRQNVAIQPVAATSLRRMVYNHPDPGFAALLLSRIHDLSDRHIRSDIREEATQRVAYLQDAIQGTLNPEHRRALTTLLMEQERLRMLVSIDQPYAAALIEPAAASAKPVWPDYPLLFSVFILGFAALGFVLHGFLRSDD